MKTKHLVGGALCIASIVGMGGSVFAGEGTGSGQGGPAGDGVTGAVENGNSPCLFSGLEDGSEGGEAGPGNVQNWGHTKPFLLSLGIPVTGANGGIPDPFGGEAGCNARDYGHHNE